MVKPEDKFSHGVIHNTLIMCHYRLKSTLEKDNTSNLDMNEFQNMVRDFFATTSGGNHVDI